jgi:hypothetical protein
MVTRIARTTLTIKLTAGKDDDLIAWLASLPKGERQVTAKQLLRDGVRRLHDNENRLAQIGEDTAWLRAALSEMPTWMEGLLSHVVVTNASETATPDVKAVRTGQLSTEGVARREKRIAKATW